LIVGEVRSLSPPVPRRCVQQTSRRSSRMLEGRRSVPRIAHEQRRI
jgi:hypothetical protein